MYAIIGNRVINKEVHVDTLGTHTTIITVL